MLDKIITLAEKYNMFPPNSCVVCGLSGGADSVCLLVSLFKLREHFNIDIEAVHVNHCIRGEESDRDENFCRELCKKLGITLTVVSCNVPEYAKKHGLSLEEAARKLRYDAFEKNAQGKIIATAHNAGDNIETALLNLIRGSGVKGIAGIPPVRYNIVRPLLSVSRKEIEEFLRKEKLSFVTDSTNLSDDYTRNKIRHRIIPEMEQINSSLIQCFAGSSQIIREENAFIEAETAKALDVCRKGNSLYNLKDFHSLIRRRCITALLSDNNLSYSRDILERCEYIALNGGKINLKKNAFLVSDGNITELKTILPANEPQLLSKELVIGDNIIFDGKTLVARLIDSKFSMDFSCRIKGESYLLDYDKIKGKLILRNRRNGDKIKLCGRNFTSSVKKLINEKISPDNRQCLHFLEDSEGTVLAEKLGVAQRVSTDADTKRILQITVISDKA